MKGSREEREEEKERGLRIDSWDAPLLRKEKRPKKENMFVFIFCCYERKMRQAQWLKQQISFLRFLEGRK